MPSFSVIPPSCRALPSMRKAAVCCGAVAAIALAVSSASAEVIFDTNPYETDGSYTVAANNWRAQAFSTTTFGWTIESIALNASGGSASRTFAVRIRESNAGQPGAIAATIFSGTRTGSFGELLYDGLDVALSPNSPYFLSVEPSVGSFNWFFTNDVSFTSATSTNSGGAWTTNTTQPFQATIVAVPEPGNVFLAGLGVSALAWACRRLRRSSAVGF